MNSRTRGLLTVGVLAGSFIAGCSSQDTSADKFLKPYFVAKPRLPDKPRTFCASTEPILRTVAEEGPFVCSDRLDGALGAKIVQSCGEVVLIQGVNREWFLFAYRRAACNEAEAPIDARDLDQLNRRLEASLL